MNHGPSLHDILHEIYDVGALLGLVGSTLLWIYRSVRQYGDLRRDVKEIMQNHLPHQYHLLKLICAKLRIVDDYDPPSRRSS